MFKDLKMVIFLLLLSSVSILILAYVNSIYLSMEGKRFLDLYGIILDSYEVKYSDNEIENVFHANFDFIKKGERTYFISKNSNRGSVVMVHEGPGLWSMLELLIIVNRDLKSLISLSVLSQGETPGLGGRVTEDEFLSQFQGVLLRPQLSIVKRAKRDNEVDALSGATGTSIGVQDIINNAITLIDREIREELNVPE
jgi:Na+-transporting NADH:ubiquinone oxidoreductase subunit C